MPMSQLMFGHGHDRSPGVQELLDPEGVTDRGGWIPTGSPRRTDLVVAPRDVVVWPREVEVVITPDLVADLYDPTLVISNGYIGPDRRRHSHSAPARRRTRPLLGRFVQVVLLTAVVVIPLTMVAARSVPPARTGPVPAPVAGLTTPQPKAGVHHRGTASTAATGKQIASGRPAHRKAPQAGATRAPTTSVAPARLPVPPTGAATSVTPVPTASQAGDSAITAQRESTRQAAAERRSAAVEARQAATQHRVDARSAAVARAAARKAARSRAEAARTAGRGGSGVGGPGGSGTPTATGA